ncbi:hypothetical protein JMUB6875_58280 [Nocardia sp. JMUB6875]|uniref:hypothetical protein n=1 Tax=Nocardia sp. JMUB6875 TaxID=3158170 RepID=UPI0032E63DB3
MTDADLLHVDRGRLRELITAVNGNADTLDTVHVDQQAAAISVAGTGVGAACTAGAQAAAYAIGLAVVEVRKIASLTNTGLTEVEAMDQHNASQFPQGN